MLLLALKRLLKLSLLFLSVFCTLFLVSCNQNSAKPINEDLGSKNERKKSKITFWNGFTGPDGQTMWEIIKNFEADYPEYEVEMEIIPWGTYFDKLMVSLGSGKPPDVFILHENELVNYVLQDAIRPLDDLINGPKGLSVSDCLPSIWNRLRVKTINDQKEPQTYGIPLDCHNHAVYYNKDSFRQLDIPLPESLDRNNFFHLAQQLTLDQDKDGRPDQWGFVFGGSVRSHLYTLTEQFGGNFLDRENGICQIDQPPSQKALQLLYDAINKDGYMPNPIHDGSNLWQGFLQGRIAMYTDGIWMMNGMKKLANFDWGILPYPQFGDKKAVWGSSHILCLPRLSDTIDLEAAWLFIKYLSTNGVEWSDGGQLPARYSQLTSPKFTQKEHYPVFASQIPDLIFGPNDPNIIEIETRMEPCLLAAMSGQQPMEKMVQEIKVSVESILRRSRK